MRFTIGNALETCAVVLRAGGRVPAAASAVAKAWVFDGVWPGTSPLNVSWPASQIIDDGFLTANSPD
jgi:hypothetical protein